MELKVVTCARCGFRVRPGHAIDRCASCGWPGERASSQAIRSRIIVRRLIGLALILALSLSAVTGCASVMRAGRGAVGGAASGGPLGGAIGHGVAGPAGLALGAVAGAAIGGTAGALLGLIPPAPAVLDEEESTP
jgi:hypothetical protein